MVDSSKHGLVHKHDTLPLAPQDGERVPEAGSSRAVQLERFLALLIPVILGFAVVYYGMGVQFEDGATVLGAIVIAVVGMLLVVARWQAQRRQTHNAVVLIAASFLSAIVILSFLQPRLAPSNAMVPVLIALLVLLYAPNPDQRATILSCGFTTAVVLASGELSPFASRLPEAIITILRLSMAMANLVFALLLIGQLRQLLLAALQDTQAGYTALSDAHRALHERARHDALTGLLQRGELEGVCKNTISDAARHGTACGIILLDIDHFKAINDTFGHAAGDMVLQTLGQLLRTTLRVTDWACRYGGEEFVLILPNIGVDAVIQRAEQLRQHVQMLQLMHNGQALGPITISVGVAVYPHHGMMVDELLQAADAVLYEAKRSGRNCVRVARKSIVLQRYDA